MKTNGTYSQLLALVSLLIMVGAGCTNEENTPMGPDTLDRVIITGSIGDATTVQTREVAKDQFGSYVSGGFDIDDQIGFYSQYNNEGEANGFQNLCLTYTTDSNEGYQTFASEDDALGDTPSNWGNVFAYHNYSSSNTDDIINIYETGEDGKEKVVDLLTASASGLSGGMIHFSFQHRFSMLFIMLGQGFEDAIDNNENGVEVVLKQGVTNATVNAARTDVTLNKDTEGKHKIFTAVANTEEETINSKEYGADTFFYVLLPSEVEVDYIKIVDDFGKTQYIRPTSAQLPKLVRGTRYPITVLMQGDEPTLWPWEFTPWGEQTIIVEEQDFGINGEEDFVGWYNAYNAYMSEESPNPEGENGKALLDYGSYDDGKWTFYLRADIDCSKLYGTDGQVPTQFLKTFQDELNGQNHTLSNLTLSGGVIGTLKENGKISNLKLENVTIVSEEANGARGGIVNEMQGGAIENCEVSGLRIEAQGSVGAIAGTVSGGSITGNKCSGTLIGTESVSDNTHGSYIVGSIFETPMLSGNTSNVIFHAVNSNNEPTE